MSQQDKPVLSVGLVAFGLSGRVFHAPFIISHPLFQLVAVHERGNKTESLQFCNSHGYTLQDTAQIDIHRTVEELCARADIDLIVVCR